MVISGTTISSNITFYAVWQQNTATTYTITYNANGGSGAPASQTKTHDLPLTLSSTIPTRPGYDFLGWSISNTATAPTYLAGGSFTANANTTLYAVWGNADITTPRVRVSSVSGRAGNDVTVEVKIENNPGFDSLVAALNYDSSILAYKSSSADLLSSGIFMRNEAANKFNVSWTGGTSVLRTNGTLFTVTFTIKSGVNAGSYSDLALTLGEMVNIDAGGVSISPNIVDGKVTVINITYGDINDDGVITASDATLVLRYIVGLNTFDDNQKLAADVNNDGQITASDATIILRYIVGLVDKLGS
jgi:uncharacterized repeat protein (TIGR02543 family)